jgi:hypothetical protein
MIDYLEKDRDNVMNGLRTASTPADAQKILEIIQYIAGRQHIHHIFSYGTERIRDF